MNELIDVLSVWWIKVLFDMIIVYHFVKITKSNKHKENYNNINNTISHDIIP